MFLEQELYVEGFNGKMRRIARKPYSSGQYGRTNFLYPSSVSVFTNPHKNYSTIIISEHYDLIAERYLDEVDDKGLIVDASSLDSIRLFPGEELFVRRVVEGERERAISLWMPLVGA